MLKEKTAKILNPFSTHRQPPFRALKQLPGAGWGFFAIPRAFAVCHPYRPGLTPHQASATIPANTVYAATNTHQGASQYSSRDSQCSMKLSE